MTHFTCCAVVFSLLFYCMYEWQKYTQIIIIISYTFGIIQKYFDNVCASIEISEYMIYTELY